jgi:hypothetical protein
MFRYDSTLIEERWYFGQERDGSQGKALLMDTRFFSLPYTPRMAASPTEYF